jgi:arylsulfatase
MSTEKNRDETKAKEGTLDRRSILLGGTTLAAVSALGSATQIQTTQAQAQPAPAGGKPNILFIMGDDIGWFNISAYNMGIMGYRTPNPTSPTGRDFCDFRGV